MRQASRAGRVKDGEAERSDPLTRPSTVASHRTRPLASAYFSAFTAASVSSTCLDGFMSEWMKVILPSRPIT